MSRTSWDLGAAGLLLAFAGIAITCGPSQQAPDVARDPEAVLTLPSGPTGAIFTTIPNGGIVNENVHYPSKPYVYLDGGPGQNAPQGAAGLDDGEYVFQVTDPSGRYLLSMDPAKCRVVEVEDGVIKRLVPATELGFPTNDYTVGNGGGATTYPCHVADAPNPPGAADADDFGPSARHDTNVDVDHGANGAVVVQLMPFGTTPNPGGVYKAWVTPVGNYTGKGGNLATVPRQVNGRAAQPCPDFCANADPGFGPPRNIQKTDNFKVLGAPPRLDIVKIDDADGDGVYDAGEQEITGWLVTVGEPLFDGSSITNAYYTPASVDVAPNTTVTVCEEVRTGWAWSFALVDGAYVAATAETFGGLPFRCVDVPVGAAGTTVAIAFGNFEYGSKSGVKFEDLNANGARDAGEPGLEGWTIQLTGTDGAGNAVSLSTSTNAQGEYSFGDLAPGTYTAAESCPAGETWYQSLPCAQADFACACGSGDYDFTLVSGQDHENNDFGNWRPATKSGHKLFVHGAFDGTCDGVGNESGLGGWTVALLDAAGAVIDTTTTASDGAYAFTGLAPGAYRVCEGYVAGFYQLFPASGFDCGAVNGFFDWGYAFTLVSGQQETNNDFCNTANCVGLTPGYWGNWRNHYTSAQFSSLLAGTIASGISAADTLLTSTGCDDGDAIDCLRRFLLATQLTLNLTSSPSLPNPSGGDLKTFCELPGDAENLGYWLAQALAIHANPGAYSRDAILVVKTWLDGYANLKQIVYVP